MTYGPDGEWRYRGGCGGPWACRCGVAPLSSGDLEALAQRLMLHALVDLHVVRRVPALIPAVAPPVRRATEAQLEKMLGVWAGNGLVIRTTAAGDCSVWRAQRRPRR